MKPNCEYCGAVLPEGVDKRTRQIRSAHSTQHAEARKEEDPVYFTARNTVDKQPEALRLADDLPALFENGLHDRDDIYNTAAELRRLHALCDEMGEALERVERWVREADEERGTGFNWRAINEDEGEQARAALDKWKESK